MKFEIILSKEDYRSMQKNKYGHDSVLTRDYMLDILHDIINQMDVSRPYESHLHGLLKKHGSMTVKDYDSAKSEKVMEAQYNR
jgi:predicted HicB family RNase H-like nuclease